MSARSGRPGDGGELPGRGREAAPPEAGLHERAGVIVLFRSRRSPHDETGYAAMAHEMLERARTMPGFVDFRHYAGEEGERLSVVWWEDEATMERWREDTRHQLAQRLGRERWYDWFAMDVAHVVRAYGFTREGD